MGPRLQNPLSSGQIAYKNNGVLQWFLSGASPNATYVTYESVTRDVDSSGASEITSFSTDASGGYNNYTAPSTPPIANVFPSSNGGDIFTIEPQDKTHAGWIGGFSVPQ